MLFLSDEKEVKKNIKEIQKKFVSTGLKKSIEVYLKDKSIDTRLENALKLNMK